MELQFRDITFEDKKILDSYSNPSVDNLGWDYSFPVIYIWNAFFTTKVCHLKDMSFVYTVFFNKTVFFPPFLKEPQLINKAVALIEDFCREEGVEMEINGVCPRDIAFLDKDKYETASDRNSSDYIYSAKELIELEGKKFHSKRNFITRFKAKYEYIFREYRDSDYDAVLNVYDNWYKKSIHEILDLERNAVISSLKNYKELDLKIAVLEVENKVIGYSINLINNDTVAHAIFEKCDTEYDGVYQMINFLTCEKYFSGVLYVNRQEDMGIEGLRKSKLSYNPVIIFDKYNIWSKK